MALDVSLVAKESGLALCEEWVRAHAEADLQVRVLHVECGFRLWLDERTLVVGMQDAVMQDDVAAFGNEWKSTREPSRYWTEEKWLEELVNGSQLAVYALALHEGEFYEQGSGAGFKLGVPEPRIRVRAAVKSLPPAFWPSDPARAVYRFPTEMFPHIRNAYLNKAEKVRALRKHRRLPWQYVGKHCEAFNRKCEHYGACKEHRHVDGERTVFDASDPGSIVLVGMDAERLADPELVVLSASSYETGSRCMELFRLVTEGHVKKERNLALETGTAMHAALAVYYRQIREMQSGKS